MTTEKIQATLVNNPTSYTYAAYTAYKMGQVGWGLFKLSQVASPSAVVGYGLRYILIPAARWLSDQTGIEALHSGAVLATGGASFVADHISLSNKWNYF